MQSDPHRTLLTLLRSVKHAATDPALLVVIPMPTIQSSLFFSGPHPSLRAVAAAADKHLIVAGRVTALVPRTMTVISTKPGKANPFSDLSPAQTLPLLLSSFSPAQWKQASSTNGIGVRDLRGEQRLFWSWILPEQARVVKTTVGRDAQSHLRKDSKAVLINTHPRSTGRLRLNKVVDVRLLNTGIVYERWVSYPYTDYPRVREANYTLAWGFNRLPEYRRNTAYGVSLISEVPLGLKKGAVNFSAASLDTRVSLTDFPRRAATETVTGIIPPEAGYSYELDKFSASPEFPAFAAALTDLVSLPTVGDLLARISKATHREFVADSRVRDLHIYLHGNSARAGDLLEALCWSVAGTFRKMAPGSGKDSAPLYLLTDDVTGIGTRHGILAEWGEAAEEAKWRLLNNADAATAASKPLDYLAFAPNDPFTLSPAQAKNIEDYWRSGYSYSDPPVMLYADMPPALQEAVQNFAIEHRIKNGAPIRTDRAAVSEMMKAVLILPEIPGAAVELHGLQETIGNLYLQRIAALATTRAMPSPMAVQPAAPAPGFTASALRNQRRTVIARPANAAEAVQIVHTAIGRGIEAIWLETNLTDPKTEAALLTAATRAGGTKISVGGVVRLLKGSGLSGTPDRNILGETGGAYSKRRLAAHSNEKQYADYYEGRFGTFSSWIAPAPPRNF